jgi:hypothetical protein
MFDDSIVAQTRRVRDAYAASLGYDLKRIVADLESRQGKDGRHLIERLDRPIAPCEDRPDDRTNAACNT